MATLIPTINSCLSRMESGEKRFAQRLEDKLEEDYLCWYDISIGERTQHPDFVVFHPSRGVLVLEVKDWRISTIISLDKQCAQILTGQGLKNVLNPIEQARQYMFAITNKLERDPQLVWSDGKWKGRLIFPYGHGLVLANISRKQFNDTNLAEVLPEHLVICQDEMTETTDAESFQQRMWAMFPVKFDRRLTLPQIDRIRWHMFPEIRLTSQHDMFSETEIPDILRVMDIQQEQLARSLGEGHRVIHGVAGSGKTLILGYRAEHLAKVCQRPILILCYNRILAAKLSQVIKVKGLEDKIHAVSFHAWCNRQLDTYHAGKPPQGPDLNVYFEECVNRVIRSVEQKIIPSAQYDAVLIDEGHDFKPEWFKLVVQMIHPDTNSLLVLYDDAQSIYNGPKKLRFSFSSVGVQAKGRTTILKLNYRNTAEILSVARAFADELLKTNETEEDQVPTVQPMSAGRHGAKPLLIKLPTLKAEADFLANKLVEANRTGTPWNDMAVIYRRYGIGQQMTEALKRRDIPFQWQQDKKKVFAPSHDGVKIITMHSSKGLEFPLVCIPAIGVSSSEEDDIQDEARLLYVAMTRATQELVMTHCESSVIVEKMHKAMSHLHTL
ncbi:3'-5' exonuclease [Undibacterium sp. TS12]|uniref:DEAD/DEAH box helicase n=1 Tax=Undibacterium sp. TS12 TaxID=2908202 RepID=UPI001F4C5536|nr:3'-5' exonuclease [Undibacterium sp. TS12]MCH8619862.1 NERD domain-containing protein [Undibacterium sp. TS12]